MRSVVDGTPRGMASRPLGAAVAWVGDWGDGHSVRHCTMTDAIILGWIEQRYLSVPGLSNLKVNDSFWSIAPERKRPSTLVTVCGSPSRFFQVTDVPALTVIDMGAKLKFLMTTAFACCASAVPRPDAEATVTIAANASASSKLRPEILVSMRCPCVWNVEWGGRCGTQPSVVSVSVAESGCARILTLVTPSILGSWSLGTLSGPGPRTVAGRGLRIGGGARGVEGDIAFHLLHDLVDMAVQHGDGTEPAQIAHRLVGVAGSPAPRLIDRPHRHVREHNDWRAGRAAFQILLEPGELVGAEAAKPIGLEVHHIDQRDEVHAVVIEAVISLVGGGLAEAVEIFRSQAVSHVVLAGNGMKFRDVQA